MNPFPIWGESQGVSLGGSPRVFSPGSTESMGVSSGLVTWVFWPRTLKDAKAIDNPFCWWQWQQHSVCKDSGGVLVQWLGSWQAAPRFKLARISGSWLYRRILSCSLFMITYLCISFPPHTQERWLPPSLLQDATPTDPSRHISNGISSLWPFLISWGLVTPCSGIQ